LRATKKKTNHASTENERTNQQQRRERKGEVERKNWLGETRLLSGSGKKWGPIEGVVSKGSGAQYASEEETAGAEGPRQSTGNHYGDDEDMLTERHRRNLVRDDAIGCKSKKTERLQSYLF